MVNIIHSASLALIWSLSCFLQSLHRSEASVLFICVQYVEYLKGPLQIEHSWVMSVAILRLLQFGQYFSLH